jgi:2-polyprenyl-3-methyl-5-hydroxy-6-metoxy-1,4-benzoquinol methylase
MSFEKENKVENWNVSYQELKTTYSEALDTPPNLGNRVQYEFVLEDINRFLPNPKQAKILECGCGGARTSLYVARRGFAVTCTDNSPEAIRLAKDNFAALNVNATFIQDNLLDSKIPSESFDCVMSFGLLEHFVDLQPLLASTTRLVKPGGIQIHCVIPKKFSTQTLMYLLMYPAIFANNLLKRRLQGIFQKSFRDFPHYENRFSAREYCQAFEAQGNTILRCEAGGVLFPFINLPGGVGNWLVRTFPNFLYKVTKKLDRSQSRLLHLIAPTFYIVCRRQ